ncbi:MAG: GAF domain-containing protein [Anaerolineales bacterium]|jgi:hypothetical protein|uniref:GAF domain-containing protein n=1 Tax=Candidatus Villigracilis vicinus TaxID=3140679 RepID=UPI003135DF8B|nr:GAF domain-containing protein [Anaerolineales bacterium]MBK7450225.1 GAF domain-containing protein [Anaerolineales bacterium]MBK9781755.1 GAF domain-containing protein [Anaerolineales bacterium]
MRISQVPHYFNIFPTGNIPVPVCIGDLPMSDYIVSDNVMTDEVADYLDANPLVPGAILIRDNHLTGMIPRGKMFERLGRRYGVELFLRKPICEMRNELKVEALTLKGHLSINLAVKLALSRSQEQIYDPVIVEFENGEMRLLDIYLLLLSQSQLSNNLSGIVSSLNTIEMMLANDRANSINILDLIMESLAKVVPAHHARLVIQHHEGISMLHSNHIMYHIEPLELNSIYRSVLEMKQPITLEDVNLVPAWINLDTPRNTRSWIGAPIMDQTGAIGLISLSRNTFSPFTPHEKEISLVFSRYLGKLFENHTRQMEKRLAFQRKYQVQ